MTTGCGETDMAKLLGEKKNQAEKPVKEKPVKEKKVKEKKIKAEKPVKEKPVKEKKIKEKKVKVPKEKGAMSKKLAGAKSEVPFVRSIAMRLTLCFLIPVVGIVALGFLSYQSASKAIINSYTSSVGQTADMLQQYVSLVVSSEIDEFKTYFVDSDLKGYFNGHLEMVEEGNIKNTYNKKLYTKTSTDGKIVDIYFFADGGRTIKADTKLELMDDAYSAYIATEQGKKVDENPNDWFLFGQDKAADEAMGIDTSTYSIRIARKFVGMPVCMVIDVEEEFIRSAMQSLDPGTGGYVALVTSDGNELFSDAEVSTDTPLVAGTDFYTKAMELEDITGSQTIRLNGKQNLFVYGKLSVGDAIIAAVIPSNNLLAQTKTIKQVTILLIVISAALALVLGMLLSRSMTGTIQYILGQLRKVSEGDFTISLKSKRKDEFGLLCDGVNQTVEKMKGLLVEVNDVSLELNGAASHVQETANMFMETSEGIQRAVSEIEEGANKLDGESADCLRQMDTLSGKITNVSVNTGEIEKLTAAAGQTIYVGIESVQSLKDSAQSTTDITRDVIKAIEELEKKSHSIDDIVGTINEISEETRLLSLNASIEAARAGSAGRGFAVVAEEIRNLSDQCMDAAGQISELIEEIVKQTVDVSAIAKQAQEAVSSQTDVVENTTASFREIENQVEGLISALQLIITNVQDMDESRNVTLGSIESISAVSAETAACSTTVYTQAGTQLDATKNLDDASNQLREKADRLMEVLNTFRL